MTTPPEGWTTKFLDGMGAYLADQGVGTWDPPSGFAEGDIAIVVDDIPDTPTLLVTLTAYPIDELPGLADVRMAVQVRTRGDQYDPRVRNNLADACFDVLHGLEHVTWNGIAVVHVFRQTWAPIGQDPARRYERSDTYFVDAMRPNILNPD